MADKKLTLTTRKNLRDNEEKKVNNLKRIEAASGKTGVEFVIKNDITVADALASRGYADRMGEIFYESYLSQLAEVLEKLCSDANSKAAFANAWTSNKIFFEIDEKTEGYQSLTFSGGDLRMACKSDNLWANISYLGNEIESLLVSSYGDTTLPLKTSANLRQNEEKKNENLGRIASATGKTSVEFQFKDVKAVDKQLNSSGYENRVGEIFYGSYLQTLAENLSTLCADQASKDALNRKWTSNRILFELDAKAPTYQSINFPSGDLRISCKPENIWANISYLGDDIVDQLTSDYNEIPLPLKSAQNIREYEEKAQTHLATIGTAIGRGGTVTYMVDDIKGINDHLATNGYAHRAGEIIWGAYLSELASKLTTLCADDMVKEAIGDAFKGNLVFRLDPKCEGYQNTKFEGGNLVMFCRPSNIWANISSLGDDIEKQL